jgi:hypothetical protein
LIARSSTPTSSQLKTLPSYINQRPCLALPPSRSVTGPPVHVPMGRCVFLLRVCVLPSMPNSMISTLQSSEFAKQSLQQHLHGTPTTTTHHSWVATLLGLRVGLLAELIRKQKEKLVHTHARYWMQGVMLTISEVGALTVSSTERMRHEASLAAVKALIYHPNK